MIPSFFVPRGALAAIGLLAGRPMYIFMDQLLGLREHPKR
jgi:hypothetical protein